MTYPTLICHSIKSSTHTAARVRAVPTPRLCSPLCHSRKHAHIYEKKQPTIFLNLSRGYAPHDTARHDERWMNSDSRVCSTFMVHHETLTNESSKQNPFCVPVPRITPQVFASCKKLKNDFATCALNGLSENYAAGFRELRPERLHCTSQDQIQSSMYRFDPRFQWHAKMSKDDRAARWQHVKKKRRVG